MNADNLANAVALAYTLQQLDQPDRARQLLEDDRYLQSVSSRPEFQAIVQALKADLKVMSDRALAAEESNDWDELRNVAAEKLAPRG